MQGTKVQAWVTHWGGVALVAWLVGCGGAEFKAADDGADAGTEADAGVSSAGEAGGGGLGGAAGLGGAGAPSAGAGSGGAPGGNGGATAGASGAQQAGGAGAGGAGGASGGGGAGGEPPRAVNRCGGADSPTAEPSWECVTPAGACGSTESGKYGNPVGDGHTYAERCLSRCELECPNPPFEVEGIPVVCEYKPEVTVESEEWCNCRCDEPLTESVVEWDGP